MGISRRGIFSGLICIGIVMVISCGGDNDSGPTSSHSYRIGEVQWPPKYSSSSSSRFCFNVPVTVSSDAPHLWYQVGWRQQVTDQFVYYDSSFNLVSTSGTQYCCLNYHDPGPGIYNLRIGLTSQLADLYKMAGPDESRQFNFYVGSSYYYHDVEIEYRYQDNCEIFYGRTFDQTVAPAFKNTRVVFTLTENTSSLPQVTIENTEDALLRYRHNVGAYWDPDSLHRPKCHYFLCGVSKIVKPNDTLTQYQGASSPTNDISLVAVGCINDPSSFPGLGSYYARYATAAHELGHIIGEGLNDVCDHVNEHDQNTPCIMRWLKPKMSELYNLTWCCSSDDYGFNPDIEFCQRCLTKLNDITYLRHDYSGPKMARDNAFLIKGKR